MHTLHFRVASIAAVTAPQRYRPLHLNEQTCRLRTPLQRCGRVQGDWLPSVCGTAPPGSAKSDHFRNTYSLVPNRCLLEVRAIDTITARGGGHRSLCASFR